MSSRLVAVALVGVLLAGASAYAATSLVRSREPSRVAPVTVQPDREARQRPQPTRRSQRDADRPARDGGGSRRERFEPPARLAVSPPPPQSDAGRAGGDRPPARDPSPASPTTPPPQEPAPAPAPAPQAGDDDGSTDDGGDPGDDTVGD